MFFFGGSCVWLGFLNNTCFFLASEKKVAVHLSMWKSSDNHFKPIAASKGEETLRDAELVSFAKKPISGLRRKREKLNILLEGKTTKYETRGIMSSKCVFKQSTHAARAKHSMSAQAGAAQELCEQLQIWQKLAVLHGFARQW